MDQKKSVPFDKLLQAVALGNVEPEVLSASPPAWPGWTRPHRCRRDKIIEASGGHEPEETWRAASSAP
jgi:type I restriction enzyme R subunit